MNNDTDDRKHYHNLEANFYKQEAKEKSNCPHCGGPMETNTAYDTTGDSGEIYSDEVCKNPDCITNNY